MLYAASREVWIMTRRRKPKLGSGARFRALTKQLRARGARNPEALAAWIGRRKYGAKRFGSLSAKRRSR
jgi:hypothetical protein